MNLQLTISMLVSDRMETLGKCLASLKPLLRELDSELIVVFTGKRDDALALVRQYTSQVIPFVWCNDFSKARNAGLKEAKGEWFLYLDDDEWFEDASEIIQFFKSGEYLHYHSASYIQRNYLEPEGKRFIDTDVGRMCRLTPETRFVYSVHENLDPFPGPNKKLAAYVHHFGYVRKENLGQEGTKTNRNLSLLLSRLDTDPGCAHCYMQITQEYRSIGEYAAAVDYCRKGLVFARKEERIHNYELWLQVNLPLLISYTGDQRLALEEGERLLKDSRTLEVGALHLCVTLTALCRDLNEYQKGIQYARLYHEKLLYLLKHPEKAKLQRAADITLQSISAKAASVYIEGLFLAAETKDFQSARQFLTWFPWDEKETVLPYYPRLEEWKNGYAEKNEEILKAYSQLSTDNVYVCIQKTLYEEKQGHLHEAETLWDACACDCPAGFQWELTEIAVRNGFSLEPLLARMPPEAWNEYAEMVTERKEWDHMLEFYPKISPLLKAYPFYQRRLEQCFLERMLSRELFAYSGLMERLHQYCASVCADALALYRTEALADPETFSLPTRYRFAVIMKEALRAAEDGRIADSFPFLKEAIQICPKMSSAVSQLLGYLEEQGEVQGNAVPEEFRILGAQVKQVLRGLIDSGQWEEAYGVMAQLLPLLPDDLEVLQMKQEILRQGQVPSHKRER